MKILIVDDNPNIRRVLKSIVGTVAEEVYECNDGSEAVIAYDLHHPSFVLMDIAMKQLDGIAATRQILRADPQAKVIIVTNYDEADLREAAQEAGASGYVLKENLFEVRRLLQPG
ncbi:MAG: response regulator transcription factor [Blastocatellia bacterium]